MEFLRPAHFLEVLSSNCTWHKNWWFGKYLQSTTFTGKLHTIKSKSVCATISDGPERLLQETIHNTGIWKRNNELEGRELAFFFPGPTESIYMGGGIVRWFSENEAYGCLQFTGHVGHVIVWAVSLTLWIAGSHPFVHSHSCFQNTKVGKHLLAKAILNAQDA